MKRLYDNRVDASIQTKSDQSRPIVGALFVLIASFLFAVLGTLVKVVSSSLNNEMVVFSRNVFALLFILPWLWYSRPTGGIRTSCLKFHMLRSAAGLSAMYCFFYAIAHLQLSEAFLLSATSPLFIPLIASAWIHESVTAHVRGAIIIGFFGVVLILKPGFTNFQPAMFVALMSGVFAALAMVTIRRMSVSEPAIRIVFYFTALSTIVSAVPLFWAWESPRSEIWWLLALIGLLASVAQFFLTRGYGLAPAAQMGPLTYGSVVFATINGWFFWNETLDTLTWVGAVLVCIAGVITTRRTETHIFPGTSGRTTPLVDKSPSSK